MVEQVLIANPYHKRIIIHSVNESMLMGTELDSFDINTIEPIQIYYVPYYVVLYTLIRLAEFGLNGIILDHILC